MIGIFRSQNARLAYMKLMILQLKKEAQDIQTTLNKVSKDAHYAVHIFSPGANAKVFSIC